MADMIYAQPIPPEDLAQYEAPERSPDIFDAIDEVVKTAPQQGDMFTQFEQQGDIFDPEGSGYDYDTATASGGKPDVTGHWGSLDPRTGMLLKGMGHESIQKTIDEEHRRGNIITKEADGRYYSKDMFDQVESQVFEDDEQQSFAKQTIGALTRGGMSLGKAILELPAHAAWMATNIMELGPGGQPTARKEIIGQSYQKLIDEHSQGVRAIIRNHPEWEYDPPESFLDLLTSPRKLSLAITESLPMLVGAGITVVAGMPNITYAILFASEGQEAYDIAIEDGVSETEAAMAYQMYGSVAAILENLQLRQMIKIGKGSYQAVLNRTAQKLAKKGYRDVTVDIVKVAAKEALEEMSQGAWQEYTAKTVYDKDIPGGLWDFIDRRAQEGLIGGTMGAIPGIGGVSLAKARNLIDNTATQIEITPEEATEILAEATKQVDITAPVEEQQKQLTEAILVEVEVARIVSRFPDKVTDQKSLKEVGNAIAKYLGIDDPIMWSFAKRPGKGDVSGWHQRRGEGHRIHIAPGTRSFRTITGIRSQRATQAGMVGEFGERIFPSQGNIKRTIVHELGHIAKKPILKGARGREVHHLAFVAWVEESVKELFAEKIVGKEIDLGKNVQLITDAHNIHGGSTIDIKTGESITEGYSISPYPNREVKIPKRSITSEQLRSFISQNSDLLKQKGTTVGTWYNTEDDTTYLDVTIVEQSKEKAIKLGKEKNQLAIYDLAKGEEIAIEAKPVPAIGEKYEGPAYRAKTGVEVKGTAADVVRFEQEELGNDLGVSEEKLKELEKRPASDIVWVTRTKEEAARYGLADIAEEPTVEEIEAIPEDVSEEIVSGEVITDTGPEGVLVLKPTKTERAIEKITPKEKVVAETAAPQQKLLERFGEDKKPTNSHFINPDGTIISVSPGTTHEKTCEIAGTTLKKYLDSGGIRIMLGFRGAMIAIEATKQITPEQQSKITPFIRDNKVMQLVMEIEGKYSKIENTTRPVTSGQVNKLIDRLSKRPLERMAAEDKKLTKKQALHLGHKIPAILGMTEADRRGFMMDLMGKSSMKDMTLKEMRLYVANLMVDLEKAGKLGELKETAEQCTEAITASNKRKVIREIKGLNKHGFDAFKENMISGVARYLDGLYRIERLCELLDGYTEGPNFKNIFMPVTNANMEAIEAKRERGEKFVQAIEKIMDSREAVEDLVSQERQHIADRTKENPAIDLSPVERIGVYLYAQNDFGLHHLQYGNFADFKNFDAALKQIVDSMSKEEKAIADWILKDMQGQFDRVKQAVRLALGRDISEQDNYFSLYLEDVDPSKQSDYLSELLKETGAKVAVAEPGEVKKRKRGARQPLRLDAFENYFYHVGRIEQFIHLAPITKSVGEIVNNREYKDALNSVTHGYGVKILQKWLQNSVRGTASEASGWIGKNTLILRRNAMVYAIGGSIPTVLRQTLSGLNAMSVHPTIGYYAARHLANTANPAEYKKLDNRAFAKSQMMRTRNFDPVQEYISRQHPARRRILRKKPWSSKVLAWVRWSDKRTTVIAWNSFYDTALNSQAVQRQFGLDGTEEAAIAFADKWIRRTQPMGRVEHLPDFFRGGVIEVCLSAFQNQINNNFNFWYHDIYQARKYGKINNTQLAYRMMMSYVLPALAFGMIGRGGLPRNWKDIPFDLFVYSLGPMFLVGRIAYNAVQGFAGAGYGIERAALVETEKMIEAAMRGDLKGVAKHGIKGVGAITGRIPAQAIRTMQGVYDLTTDKTDDPRRLIWSRWSLEKGKEAGPKRPVGRGGTRRSGKRRKGYSR